MSAEYSVEELKAEANACRSISIPWANIIDAYAERIKADEGAVPVAWQFKRRPEDYPDEWSQCSKEHYDACSRREGSPWIYRELFDRPPAQAAQVDDDDDGASDASVWTLIDLAKQSGAIEDDGEDGKFFTLSLDAIYRLESELRARNISAGWPKPTAEPAAQGEATDPLADDSPLQSCRAFVESWRLESAGSNGHDLIANRNTVRRLVHIIDGLAAQPRAVPDGWVLVPSEPTDAMCDAGDLPDTATAYDIYKAVLAAAPSLGESNNKPTDCSGDPSSCPDNEGRGCYCSDIRRATGEG